MESFIGVDVGSGSVRAALFDIKGNRLGFAVRPIKQNRPADDFVEQSSDDIWSQLCSAVKEAVISSKVSVNDIKGIGFDATCSLVAIDKEGKPLSVSPSGKDEWNIIMWMDHRAMRETADINATKDEVLKYVGGVISPEMELPKLLWLKRNMKQQYSKCYKFFDLPDYLVYKATNADVRSVCTTVCKWTYLAHENRWSKQFFEKIGLDDLLFDGKIGETVAPLGGKAGTLSSESATEMGLVPGIAVAVAIIDAHAGGIGVLGKEPEHSLALIGGTSSCHMAVSKTSIFVPGVWGPYYGAMLPGYWLSEGGQSATGALIDHTIKNAEVYPVLEQEAKTRGITVYEVLNEAVILLRKNEKQPAENYHVLDYHHGNRSPRADATLKGMVSGASLNRTKEEAAKQYLATIQAVAYGTRHIIDEMNKNGHSIRQINICGGGTKNPLFLQEHADITGCKIVLSKEPEAVLLGSAILGAAAANAYSDIFEAMKGMNGEAEVVLPDTSTKVFHERKYKVYLEMYNDQLKYKNIMQGEK